MNLVIVIEPDAALRGMLWARLAALGDGAWVASRPAELRLLQGAQRDEPRLVIARGDGTARSARLLARQLAPLLARRARLVVLECGVDVPRGRVATAYLHEVDRVIAAALFLEDGTPPPDLAIPGTLEGALAGPQVDEAYACLPRCWDPATGILRHETDGRSSLLAAPWLTSATAPRRVA